MRMYLKGVWLFLEVGDCHDVLMNLLINYVIALNRHSGMNSSSIEAHYFSFLCLSKTRFHLVTEHRAVGLCCSIQPLGRHIYLNRLICELRHGCDCVCMSRRSNTAKKQT